ncbi:tRNA threonylcarbamoyladenosine dehydratase [Brucepastera parasyntrophica]|uniref:tRNA threonylcarbamoyladenosine dehydratase n=1 Tax=Brucepastera parasyntrophica TaxID=2880008 RepID=UPI002109EC42|nr:tRNA threonylcarbamoyladenosine dehydratase [Brucepastera parasyntrophica]ULQ58545.1 tRNA threonylcarbamoyladenosine dehydratase [Brucepastera parasyntrophica]
MDNQFSRSELLLGPESTGILAGKTVAVFGIGGVGSFAAEALARSGIGNFVLVDNDIVSLSNINRQIIALHSTLDRPKVDVMRERILDINPAAQVTALQLFYKEETANAFDFSGFSYILDCIDTVSSKLLLIQEAERYNIPLISTMGTGNKLDPTRLEFADIKETGTCPLARIMRRELKKRGIKKLTVLYSREDPLRPHQDGDVQEADCDMSMVPGKRTIPGSVPFVPPAAGLMIAGKVVTDLLKK